MLKNTVTIEQVKENMQDVIVRTLDDFGKPCTYVTVRMKNGFTLRESTTCVDPANYNEDIGKEVEEKVKISQLRRKKPKPYKKKSKILVSIHFIRKGNTL